MQIVFVEDSLPDISNPIFWGKLQNFVIFSSAEFIQY